jgi:hypothetical protein
LILSKYPENGGSIVINFNNKTTNGGMQANNVIGGNPPLIKIFKMKFCLFYVNILKLPFPYHFLVSNQLALPNYDKKFSVNIFFCD